MNKCHHVLVTPPQIQAMNDQNAEKKIVLRLT